MRHSLHSHIIYLEESVQALRDRLTGPRRTPDENREIEQQLCLAELALARYREAYALELSVSEPNPPDRPGTRFNGGGGAERSNIKYSKDGLTAIDDRKRKKARIGSRPSSFVSGKIAYVTSN